MNVLLSALKGALIPAVLVSVFLFLSKRSRRRCGFLQRLGWGVGFATSYFFLLGWPPKIGQDVMAYLFYVPVGIAFFSLFYGHRVTLIRPLMRALPTHLLFIGIVFWLFVSRHQGELHNLAFVGLMLCYLMFLTGLDQFYRSYKPTLGLWHALMATLSLGLLLLLSGSVFLAQISAIVLALLVTVFAFDRLGWSGVLDYYWTEFFGGTLMVISLAGVLFVGVPWWKVVMILTPAIFLPWLQRVFYFDNMQFSSRLVIFWLLPVIVFHLPVLILTFKI